MEGRLKCTCSLNSTVLEKNAASVQKTARQSKKSYRTLKDVETKFHDIGIQCLTKAVA